MLLPYYLVKVFLYNLVISAFRTGRIRIYYKIWIENNFGKGLNLRFIDYDDQLYLLMCG